MQILNTPDFFTAMARLLSHGVGSSIGAMTSSCCSRSNTCFNLVLSDVGRSCDGDGGFTLVNFKVHCSRECSYFSLEYFWIVGYYFLHGLHILYLCFQLCRGFHDLEVSQVNSN